MLLGDALSCAGAEDRAVRCKKQACGKQGQQGAVGHCAACHWQEPNSCDVRWAYLMAASLVTMLSVILVFFLAQRLFIERITLTGIKG